MTALRAGRLRNCGLFLTGSGDFYLLQSNQTGYEAHKAFIQRVLAAHPPEIKEMGHETDHSLPSSAKVHN